MKILTDKEGRAALNGLIALSLHEGAISPNDVVPLAVLQQSIQPIEEKETADADK